MTDSDLMLLYAVPFDHTLYAEPGVLGYSEDISVGEHAARIELPNAAQPQSGSIALSPPASAGSILGLHLDHEWGLQPERMPYVEIDAILITVAVRAKIDFALQDSQIGGDAVDSILESVFQWHSSLVHWLWVLSAQSLDPANPDPKVIHRRSQNIVVAAQFDQVFSIPGFGQAPIPIRVDFGSPQSEGLVNRSLLEYIVPRVGTAAPAIMWELLASARMAGRRDDVRRALIDAGTAAEAALSILMPPALGNQPTLGGQVSEAQRRGIALPVDTKVALVQPRNDAIHRGQWSPGSVNRALEIAEDIIALADPSTPRTSSLRTVNRPQRSDIKLILPPER